ncbi:MAG: hypothetical protein ACI8Q2_000548 [Candidatus Omnitrophota bacterium]|jgi:hypothetical protein
MCLFKLKTKQHVAVFLFFILQMYFLPMISYGDTVNKIQCDIGIKKPKKSYKIGKTINFQLTCQNDQEQIINIPEQFFIHSYIFALALRFENEKGEQYCLINNRYSNDMRSYRYVSHNKNEIIAEFEFQPRKHISYKLVGCENLAKLEPHKILERDEIFRVASPFLPAGSYKVWVDLVQSWETVRMGYHNLIMTKENNKNETLGKSISWEITEDFSPIKLEIKE